MDEGRTTAAVLWGTKKKVKGGEWWWRTVAEEVETRRVLQTETRWKTSRRRTCRQQSCDAGVSRAPERTDRSERCSLTESDSG